MKWLRTLGPAVVTEDGSPALGGSFAFGNCEENKDLCEVASWPAQPAAD